ncbi:ACP phosphodiesterase [Steroidobacter cummioxidans]|uniref:acyl carrier protein phosphodiesterase n=1 Tax=Steroidobacter cummioxidans TaxID=1803913 RepID=UPI000E321760|nr:ACP phosphodiesterase [Steroidobacter cummioxidans]
MNWLAHVFLSEPDVEFRLGNLLADIVRGEELRRMSERFQRGVQKHKQIDAFTDSHPLVKRSRARVSAESRRFSGVLVDVFYDHLLATSWDRYSPIVLDAFTAKFYADIEASKIELPSSARVTLDRIIRHDLLGSYRRIEGVERSLRRLSAYLSSRWSREFALEKGVADLIAHRAGFEADFAEFFPQLQAAAAERR